MSRVLIVEDEAHLAQGLRFNLEAEGHKVEVAGDGESAIELLLGHKENGHKKDNGKRGAGKREPGPREEFDAVVLDVMLPGKDGFAVADGVASREKFRSRSHADGSRSSGGCAQGICFGRRRLSSQTLRTSYPAGPAARATAPA